MLGDINQELLVQSYELTLLKPDRTIVAYLEEAYNIVYSPQLASVDELEFKIPYKIMDGNASIKNPNWELVRGDYLICLNNEQYFIIDTPQNEGNEKDSKTIHCYSLEYELNKKVVRGYKADSRSLYDIANSIDEKGIPRGILNYITQLTSWSINHIDPPLLTKFRSFDISESTVLEVLINIQKTFGCLLQYDTVNKQINVHEIQNIGENKGLFITEENYIKTIGEEIKHDEIVTRLYVYGKDNLSIGAVNPTGTNYIEAFDFYKNENYMTTSLITALNQYEQLLTEKTGDYDDPLSTPNTIQYYLYWLEQYDELLTVKKDEIDALESELKVIEDNIDVAITTGQNYSALNAQKNMKEQEITVREAERDDIKNSIKAFETSLENLKELLSKESNFTAGQLVELDYFIREKVWSDSNYADIKELYQEGTKVLYRSNQPPVQFSIDIIDFLRIVECQHDWNKLVLGDLINIQYSRFNLDIQVRLIAYTHDIDNNNLTLELSNKESLDNPYIYLNDLLSKAASTSATLDMSKYKWDKSEDNENTLQQYMINALDTAKQKVLAGKDQNIVIDEHGIHLQDVTNAQEQIRMINNVIAFTKNNWQNASLAITPSGIVAESIVGNLIAGENLLIKNTNNTFTVNGTGVTIAGGSLNITGGLPESEMNPDTVEKWNTIADEAMAKLADISDDDKLTAIEKQAIKKEWDAIVAEKSILLDQATNYGLTTPKTDYQTAFTALGTFLNNGSTLASDTAVPVYLADLSSTTKTTGGGTALRACFKEYYTKRTVLQKAVSDKTIQAGALYNGVKIDTANGLVVTASNNRSRSVFNAIEGVRLQKGDGTGSGGSWSDVIWLDSAGNANFDGTVKAKDIILNGLSVLDITKSYIKGSYIEAKGITVRDANNNVTFQIDNNGNVTLGGAISWGSKPTYTATEVGALSFSSPQLTYINGSGVYTGIIVAEQITTGTLTGLTIQTAGSGNRIKLAGNGLATYNTSNKLSGVYMDAVGDSSALRIFDNDVHKFSMFYGTMEGDSEQKLRITSTGCPMKISSGTNHMSIGTSGATLWLQGKVDFSAATVTNLNVVAKFG